MRPRCVWPKRVKTAVLSMFSTSFCTVPAFRRVEPAMTSGPVSTSMAMSTPRLMRDIGLHVMTTVNVPRAVASSRAPRTKAVRPLALMPTAASLGRSAAARAASWPRMRSSSCPASSAVCAWTRSAATPNVAGHSAASNAATRPLVPAPK